MTNSALLVTDNPAKMTTRHRTIRFKSKDLATILIDYCRIQGIEISNDCKVRIQGIEDCGSDFLANSIILCIDGD